MTAPDRVLHVTKLVVVESLRRSDVEYTGHTGQKLAQDVADTLGRAGIVIAIQVFRCEGAEGFCNAMRHLTAEVERKEHLPILHIECHGDEDVGLEFGDGSTMSWVELGEVLRPVNIAAELGLVVAVAACFGGHAIAGVDLLKPAPCFALIGSTHGLWSNELYDGLREFYVDLFLSRRSTEEAAQALVDMPLEKGQFVVVTVRQWFKTVVMGVLDNMKSPEAREAQALRQYEKARAEGFDRSLKFWREHYLEMLPRFLANYHREFFMTERFPEHARHFQQSLDDILQGIKDRGMVPKKQ
jgi:hypothetical protein